METNTQQIEALKQVILKSAGCTAKVPSDFYRIAAWVEVRTAETIGLSTLKRLYQYGGASTQPRQATLDLLAKALGYRDFANFATFHADPSPASDPTPGTALRADSLEVGDRVELRWNPGRELVATYLGHNTFRVQHSVATKLQSADTFQCPWFVPGHTALLANVIHADTTWPLYEIGKQGGLTLAKLLKQEA